MQLSKNFALQEFLHSDTADQLNIKEQYNPPPEVLENLQTLVAEVLQPLRDALGFPLTITSGYRCKALNKALQGSRTSDHMEGLAADIVCQHPKALILTAIVLDLPFDQLISEYGDSFLQPKWIHISLGCEGEILRISDREVKIVTKEEILKKYLDLL